MLPLVGGIDQARQLTEPDDDRRHDAPVRDTHEAPRVEAVERAIELAAFVDVAVQRPRRARATGRTRPTGAIRTGRTGRIRVTGRTGRA